MSESNYVAPPQTASHPPVDASTLGVTREDVELLRGALFTAYQFLEPQEGGGKLIACTTVYGYMRRREAIAFVKRVIDDVKPVSHPAAPTPEPSVMREYIARLTCFFIDNPKWIALAEEARGYIGVLRAEGLEPTGEQVRSGEAASE